MARANISSAQQEALGLHGSFGLMAFLLTRFPAIGEFFPVGGLGELAGNSDVGFEPIYSSAERTVWAPLGPIRRACASWRRSAPRS